MNCKYCPSKELICIDVQKAYRTGGTTYHREDGEFWLLGEFNLEKGLPGILDGGSIDIAICLECHKIQGLDLSDEIKQSLIDEHIKNGYNPRVGGAGRQRLIEKEREENIQSLLHDEENRNRFGSLCDSADGPA